MAEVNMIGLDPAKNAFQAHGARRRVGGVSQEAAPRQGDAVRPAPGELQERLGKVSRMGQRDLRRLLIGGAMAVVRWAAKKGAPAGS